MNTFLKTVLSIIFILMFSFSLTENNLTYASTTETALNVKGTVITKNDPLTIRKTASTSAAVLGTIAKGQTVTITAKTSNGWYKVKYSSIVGYVSATYVNLNSAAPNSTSTSPSVTETALNVKGTVITKNDPLTIRKASSTSAAVLGTIAKGQTVTITAKTSNDWYKVKYGLIVGYVSANYVTIQKDQAEKPKVDVQPTFKNVQNSGDNFMFFMTTFGYTYYDEPSTSSKKTVNGIKTTKDGIPTGIKVIKESTDGKWLLINVNSKNKYVLKSTVKTYINKPVPKKYENSGEYTIYVTAYEGAALKDQFILTAATMMTGVAQDKLTEKMIDDARKMVDGMTLDELKKFFNKYAKNHVKVKSFLKKALTVIGVADVIINREDYLQLAYFYTVFSNYKGTGGKIEIKSNLTSKYTGGLF